MRFVYGFILGVLASVISAVLYLAFAGGEYLLQLSPHYHEMVSTIGSLKEAREQRDQLSARLDALADGFDQLTRRFNELQEATSEPTRRSRGLQGGAASAVPEGPPAGAAQSAPAPHPKPPPIAPPATPGP
ncbi:MAG: hypothetical protein ABW298_09200 [Candidatus Binatia bacterium]|jgi:hypothetical protein